MSPKNALRRLLKSRLRLYVLEALSSQRPDDTWVAVTEVERGIEEDAWQAWLVERQGHSSNAIRDAVLVALQEAATSAVETFAETVSGPWLAQRIDAFVRDFRPSDLEVG